MLSLRCDRLTEQVEAKFAGTVLNRGNVPAWRVEFYIPASQDTPEGKGIAHTYVLNGNLYQLVAVGYPDDSFDQHAQVFFDSFAERIIGHALPAEAD